MTWISLNNPKNVDDRSELIPFVKDLMETINLYKRVVIAVAIQQAIK